MVAFTTNDILLLEKEMATHSIILDWRIPWTEELQEIVHSVVELDTERLCTSSIYYYIVTWRSVVLDSFDPMDCRSPGSFVHGIFRQEYSSRLPFPTTGCLPDSEIIQNLYIQLTKSVHTHILEKELCYIKWFASMSGLKKLYTVTSYCWGSLFLFLPSKPSKILILDIRIYKLWYLTRSFHFYE